LDNKDKEDSGEEELGSDLEEKIDDLVENLAFSNIGISIGHGVPGEITMKPMLYSWLDDIGVRKLAVDFLVPSLPQESFKPRVSKNGLYLELTVVLPDFFYNNGRLIEAFADEKGKNIVTVNHSMITAFTDSVNKIMAEPGNEDGTFLYRERDTNWSSRWTITLSLTSLSTTMIIRSFVHLGSSFSPFCCTHQFCEAKQDGSQQCKGFDTYYFSQEAQ
jgi:hypothetical protein